MKEDDMNNDAVILAEIDGSETIDSIKAEVARLKDENERLANKLKASESDRNLYKKWWSDKDDEYQRLFALTKMLVKFAKLD